MTFEKPRNTCPKCGSRNVMVGSFPLSCNDCDWHYLNDHPCRVCGQPARSSMSGNDITLYGCKDHPFTAEEWQACLKGFTDRDWDEAEKRVERLLDGDNR